MTTAVNITTPVGRIVQGSLYDKQTKDFDGNLLVVKTGLNAGQPRISYFFALAIPKGTETHWALTEWGKQIWAVGHAAFPVAAQRSDFAWKIDDGDSTIPNKRNRRPCDQEGFRGCWVLKLSQGFQVKCCNADGSVLITEPGAIKCGYYVQVNLNVASNDNQNNPGVYLNPAIASLQGYGPEIVVSIDPAAAGFGKAVLPPGASATPVGEFTPPATVAPQPAATAPPPAAAVPAVPHPAMMTASAPGGSMTTAAPPPPTAAKTMTAKASAPYDAYIKQGWTDALLVQHGLMNA
jgi:hypothetical protein